MPLSSVNKYTYIKVKLILFGANDLEKLKNIRPQLIYSKRTYNIFMSDFELYNKKIMLANGF